VNAAARAPGATAKVRQNLALSYALAGRWDMARIAAASDMSAADLDARMEQWAAFAQPKGAPDQVARMVLDETAEIGIATESLSDYPELITLPCYEWEHVLVLPKDHPLASVADLHLSDLANEPIITYHPSFTGRTRIDKAFAAQHLTPRIALEAIDSDVIKTYVRLGMGVGIVAEMAVRDITDEDLLVRPAGHLFGRNLARIAFKKQAYLRQFVYEFAQLLNPELNAARIAESMGN
jgi:LysR family cys regulon transcriptional activator